MIPYDLTPDAEADLKSIFRYTIKQWGKDQAQRYADLLEAGFRLSSASCPLESQFPRFCLIKVGVSSKEPHPKGFSRFSLRGKAISYLRIYNLDPHQFNYLIHAVLAIHLNIRHSSCCYSLTSDKPN